MTKSRILSIVAAVGMLAATAGGAAAEYPDKPITMVVPYAPGGTTETMARVLAKALGDALGGTVVVKTRPGAGGAIGATEVATAKPDGYTILFVASSSVVWPPLAEKVVYTADSFTYIAKVTDYQQAVVAKSGAPFKTFEELVAYSRDHRLSFGDQSAISRAYISYIAKKEGVSWTAIPTKGGGEMVPFLLGDKIDFAWSGGVHARYPGKMEVLATMNATRLKDFPDAPTIQELYGISMPSAAVVAGPKGLPLAIRDQLAAKIEQALGNEELVNLMTKNLLFPINYAGPEETAEEMKQSTEALRKVLDALK